MVSFFGMEALIVLSFMLFKVCDIWGAYIVFNKLTFELLFLHILRFWNRHLRFWLISRILLYNLSVITLLLEVFQLIVDVFEQFCCTESMNFIVLYGKHSNINQ